MSTTRRSLLRAGLATLALYVSPIAVTRVKVEPFPVLTIEDMMRAIGMTPLEVPAARRGGDLWYIKRALEDNGPGTSALDNLRVIAARQWGDPS